MRVTHQLILTAVCFTLLGAAYVGEFLATFREYPPRQEPGTFTIDRVLESLYQSNSN